MAEAYALGPASVLSLPPALNPHATFPLFHTLKSAQEQAGHTGTGPVKTTCGMGRPTAASLSFVSPADIVNCDLKSTLRVLYNLFTKYRNVE